MFWNLLTNENTKNFKRTLLWVELILLAVFVICIFSFLYLIMQSTPEGVTISTEDRAKIPVLVSWPGALEFALQFVGRTGLGGLLLIVFVGAATAQEYTWRTFHLWLNRGTPRSLLLVAKFCALLLPTLAVVLTALISGGVITAIFSMQINGALHLEQVNFWQLGLGMLRTAYALLPYVALAFLLAIATRSPVIAVGGGLAYATIIESLLAQTLSISSGSLGGVAKYLPASLADSLLSLNLATTDLVAETQSGLLGSVSAAAGIAIWTFSFLALALWIFRRQDFIG